MRHYAHSWRVYIDEQMIEVGQFLTENSHQRQHVVRQGVFDQVNFFDFSLSVGQQIKVGNGTGENAVVEWRIALECHVSDAVNAGINLDVGRKLRIEWLLGCEQVLVDGLCLRVVGLLRGGHFWLFRFDFAYQRFQHSSILLFYYSSYYNPYPSKAMTCWDSAW